MESMLAEIPNYLWEIIKVFWPVPIGAFLLSIYGVHHFNTPTYDSFASPTSQGDDIDAPYKEVSDIAIAQIQAISLPPIYTTKPDAFRRYRFRYVLALVLLFILFTILPIDYVKDTFEIQLPTAVFSRATFVLFVLTGLTTSFPWLRDIHRSLLRKLHEYATIPKQSQMTADLLYRDENYTTTNRVDKAAFAAMASSMPDGINDSEALSKLPRDWQRVYFSWLKLSCLKHQLEEVIYRGSYDKFTSAMESERKGIRIEYRIRLEKMSNYRKHENKIVQSTKPDLLKNESDYFTISTHLASCSSSEDIELKERLEDLRAEREKLEKRNRVLFYRLCIFLCLFAFSSTKEIRRVNKIFSDFGFSYRLATRPPAPNFGVIICSSALVLFFSMIYMMAFRIYHERTGFEIIPVYEGVIPGDIITGLKISLFIVVLHALTIYLGMFIKRYFLSKSSDNGKGITRIITENGKVFFVCYMVVYLVGVSLFYWIAGDRVFVTGLGWAIGPAQQEHLSHHT